MLVFADCEYNIHKSCLHKVKDACVGQKKKSGKRQSMLDKIITRKPSSNNPAASKYLHRLAEQCYWKNFRAR